MQHHGRTRRSRLVDPAPTPSRKILGHPRLVTTLGRKHRNKRNGRRRSVYNRITKDLLNRHACKLDLRETYTQKKTDQCSAWKLDFVQDRMQELGLKPRTPGEKYPRTCKQVGQQWHTASTSKRPLDRVTLSCEGEHQHHESGNTFGAPFPHALDRRMCSALLEKTSREEVFAFVAAAAGTENDDHQMEVVAREP